MTLREAVRELLQEERAWTVAELTERVVKHVPTATKHTVRNVVLYEVDRKRATWLAPGQYSGLRPDGTPRVFPSSTKPVALAVPAEPQVRVRRTERPRNTGRDLADVWGLKMPRKPTPLPTVTVVGGRKSEPR